MPGANEQKVAKIVAPVNVAVEGKKILLIDDVNDTGKTLLAASQHIQRLNPKLLKVAVLHEKENTVFKADFIAEKMIKWKWLVYQWAVTEDVLAFLEQDNMLTADEDAAREHLIQKYDLIIDKAYFHDIFLMKANYYKNDNLKER
jgi:hypoxanthine phosphoribosyltransferase